MSASVFNLASADRFGTRIQAHLHNLKPFAYRLRMGARTVMVVSFLAGIGIAALARHLRRRLGRSLLQISGL